MLNILTAAFLVLTPVQSRTAQPHSTWRGAVNVCVDRQCNTYMSNSLFDSARECFTNMANAAIALYEEPTLSQQASHLSVATTCVMQSRADFLRSQGVQVSEA